MTTMDDAKRQPPNHDLLVEAADAIGQKVREGNPYSAAEWGFILQWQWRLLQHADENDAITAERVELVERLSWALFDAAVGYGDRVADDLEGVEHLAREVREQQFPDGHDA